MHKTFLTATALLMGSTALAAPDALSREEARHLLARTGFTPAPAEIDAILGLSASEAVTQIIAGISSEPTLPMPAWADGWLYPIEGIWTLPQTQQELYYSNRYLEIEELTGWWLAEMVTTPSPLTERLTLFWHDHFATDFDNAENSQWMARQNALFRANAAGSFATLAQGILRDPAMLDYLSNTENFADDPNENLGREFLELFTLGQGRGYTEADVKEAARALTGNSVSEAGEFEFFADEHDGGSKTILGRTGPWAAEDLVQIVLRDDNFGPYIVEKLWHTFVSPTPDAAEVARLSELWKANDLALAPLLEALFLTDAFWSADNRGALIKSPVELVVGAIRATGRADISMTEAGYIVGEMGQVLFQPPNVAGWTGGTTWINDATALMRASALTAFAEQDDSAREDFDGGAMMMAAPGASSVQPTTADGDLRIGRTFMHWTAKWDETGLFALFGLFDVSYGDQTWRDLTIPVEKDPEGALIVGLPLNSCGPLCPDELEEGEDWIGLYAYEGEVAYDDRFDKHALDILGALLAHLPAILKETEDSILWDAKFAAEEEADLASYSEIKRLVGDISETLAPEFGDVAGEITFAPSAWGLDGLGGADMVADEDSLDAYLDEAAEARTRFSDPRHVYPTAADWLAALPATADAAASLLAVPVAINSTDPEDILRDLLLSPAFQVK